MNRGDAVKLSIGGLDEASTLDIALDAAADVTVSELLDAVAALPGGHGQDLAGRWLELDGIALPPDAWLTDLPLHNGSSLRLIAQPAAGAGLVPDPGDGSHWRDGDATGRADLVELTQIAGPDCGRSVRLRDGRYVLGRGGDGGLRPGRVGRVVLRLEVRGADDVLVGVDPDGPAGETVRLDGRPLEPAQPQPGIVVAAGDAVFRLAKAGTLPRHPDHAIAAFADGQGRLPLIRTPRVAVPVTPVEVAVPEPPAPPATPAPLSWLLLLAPLPIGVVMALVFSPFFLIMTAMTPLMGAARWLEAKFRAKKDAIRVAAETAAALRRFASDLDTARAEVAATARAGLPDLADLAGRARTGRRLWEVRPGDEDELRVCLGVGMLPWRPELDRRGQTLLATPELAQALADRARLIDVPIWVDLIQRSGLGVVGPADIARQTVAGVLVDLVTRHGPADLELALLIEPSRLPRWDWAKWLPHLSTDGGCPRVATDAEAAARLLTRLDTATPNGAGTVPAARPPAAPYTVILVEGDDLLTGRVASLLERLARGRGRALVIASRADRLPSVCRSFVEVNPDGTATVTDAVTGVRTGPIVAAQAATDVCVGTARALARWLDPEQPAISAMLPDRARLVDLLLLAAAGADGLGRPVGALDAATIEAWWRRRVSGLQATLGVTEQGPLTIDILADGPHGLIVGTTGAGKSELLRTVVASLACRYSPDDLTFLLVDFKGGGAFDACAGLPHTVGLVTDLDEHLAARALRCLRAELRHREHRLRDAGVSDLRDYVAPSPPLPRLLIVIDEFATLAVELPGFLSALIDVAQRGRSLGIHLLLATQRPQGVVDGKIRANTNLRVALRVQDDSDSRDVLGTRQAADIDRRHPGRAFVRLGAGEIVAVQSALVSAPAARDVSERIGVSTFDLLPDEEVAPAAPDEVAGAITDLAQLLAATRTAAADGGYDRPRVPWPAPLPDDVDAWTLPEETTPPVNTTPTSPPPVPLGVVDLPDEQRTDVWWWRPEAGGTLLLGADAAAVAAAIASACLGLARCRRPDRQKIVILDGAGYGLGDLARLPHVVAAVGVDDGERLTRVLDLLDTEVARRRAGSDTPKAGSGPEILVVLAGWSGLVEGAERAGAADAANRLERLLRDGSTVGVRLLIAAAHDRGVPARLLAQLPTKLCLRLADPSSYTGLGLRARDVPDLHGLRAMDLHGHQELQIGQYGRLVDAVARVAARYPDAVPARGVGVLPEVVPARDVLATSALSGGTWRWGIGRHYRDLSVANLALAPGMHVVVAGPPGSGRTTALRVFAEAARASAFDATICVVAADPAGWDPAAVTEVVGSFADLTAWPGLGRGVLLVDGVEGIGPAAGPALDSLFAKLGSEVVVVVAGRPEAFRGMQPWQRAATLSRTGLLLRPGADDGDVLRIRLPRELPPRAVPGRGYLVEAGGLAQVQTAYLAPVEPGHRDPALAVAPAGGVG